MNEAIEILKTKYHGWKLVLKAAKRTAINENAKLKEKILSQDIFLFNFSKILYRFIEIIGVKSFYM